MFNVRVYSFVYIRVFFFEGIFFLVSGKVGFGNSMIVVEFLVFRVIGKYGVESSCFCC